MRANFLYLGIAMNTNLIISLDKRRQKKDGTYPLIFRLTHKRRTTSISLGYSIPLSDWDGKKKEIKRNSKVSSSIARINNLIQKKKAEAMGVITQLEEQEQLQVLDVKQLRDRLFGYQSSEGTFLTYSQKLVDELLAAKKMGNARVYKNVRSTFKTYLKGRDITFEEITYRWLKKYEAYFYAQGNSANGLGFNLRTLRAIYNRAIKEGIVDEKYYPFKQYKIKAEPTAKRAISKADLKKILELDLPKENRCFHARNFFLASYMMFGMSFIDMAFLQKKDIVGDRIRYNRKKTGKPYDIKVSKALEEILETYLDGKKQNDFIFPILNARQLANQYQELDQARKNYNDALKELARLCGIEEHLTSYVARHSFATQALLSEVPLKAISQMLGHHDLNTTEIYLKSLPTEVMDDYADRLSI